jgi:tetratricopeptide (TPR) repeat protein
MAIAHDPARRYPSVEQFAEDVRRYLSGHPVAARRESFAYVASKFVKRNKLAVAVATVAMVAVIAAFVITLRQKQIAERRFDEVRGLARAVVFDIHDAIAPLPGSTPARELLVRRALVYLDNLARESSDNTPLAMELARAYLKVGDVQGRPYQSNLGDTAGARASYAKALAIASEAMDREGVQDELLSLLADAHDRLGLVDQRALHWREAMAEHQASLAMRRRIAQMTPRRALDLAQTWAAVGDATYIGGKSLPPQWRFSPAEPYEASLRALQAVPVNGALRGERLDALARANARLGGLFSNAAFVDPHDRGRCIRYHEAALQALRERAALEPSSATARRNLADQEVMTATAQLFIGDPAGALSHTAGALEVLRPLAAADPTNVEARHDIAFALHTQGRAQLSLRNAAGAKEAYEGALEILTKLAEDTSNIEARRDLAGVYSGLGEACELGGDGVAAARYQAEAKRVRAQYR